MDAEAVLRLCLDPDRAAALRSLRAALRDEQFDASAPNVVAGDIGPAHLLALAGREDELELVLARAPALAARADAAGWTPLHYAALGGAAQCISKIADALQALDDNAEDGGDIDESVVLYCYFGVFFF
jgi:ankyrin repeat protein